MKPMPAASPETEKTFRTIAAGLASDGAEVSAMFGMPSLKLSGKAFAGVFGDDLVFKLNGDAHAKALALSGAVLFDPSGMGRAMKEWVVVPKAHSAHWPDFSRASLSYLAATLSGGSAKPKTKASKPAASKATKAKPRAKSKR
jgi:hypothetical protein